MKINRMLLQGHKKLTAVFFVSFDVLHKLTSYYITLDFHVIYIDQPVFKLCGRFSNQFSLNLDIGALNKLSFP